MKKTICILLAVLLLAGIAAAAFAEEDISAFRIAAPGGAPALALAVLAAENPENYSFVAAETIAAEFANETADFIIAPINAGAKLYKAGKSDYRLAAVVSWGNLYFASQKEGFRAEDINGAELVLFGENTINASVALFALEKNGIVPAKVDYLAGAANTQTLLLTDETAIVLTAEPALTAAGIKNERVSGCAVNALLKEAAGLEGFAQAGLFVRAETLAEHPEAVKAYLALVKEAAAKCTEDPDAVVEAAVALEILPSVKVAKSALPNCAIRYVSAAEAKEQVEQTAEIDLSQFGGAVPADDFYYEAE
jgi:NitT/TauT family transport system substrate-binding protein